MDPARPFDVLVVGAGIGGVAFLHYARRAGLDAIAFERAPVVGGLWARLPAWQDIQNNRTDWALGDVACAGEDAASIVANIGEWVERFGLSDQILLDTPVARATHRPDGWHVSTPRGTFVGRSLVAATGAHNRPVVPSVRRADVRLREFHSSELADARELAGRRVVVVGGGASAYDLLDLCFAHGAGHVAWVHRSTRWMVPTLKPKHLAADLRALARLQVLDTPPEQVSRMIREDLVARYRKFGLDAIVPDEEFDLGRHQMIPGRCRMIEHYASIERHRGEVGAIEGGTVVLTTGARIDADLLLWGTGYAIDLEWLDVPALRPLTRVRDAARRCGSLFVSLDAPDLFLLAPSLLDTTSVSPWAYATASRSIVAHLRGRAHLPKTPIGEHLNFFELAKFLAAHDPESFPAGWRDEFRRLGLEHPPDAPFPMP